MGDHEACASDGSTRTALVPAVVTGTFTGRMTGRGYLDGEKVALCLACAAIHCDELRPDPLPTRPDEVPVVPTMGEYENHRKSVAWLAMSPDERLAATEKDRSGGPLTAEQYAIGEITGLPRPMVDVGIGEFYLTEAAIEHHRFPEGDYCVEAKKRLPAPWINGWHSAIDADFYSFREDVQRAHDERLCCICGDPMLGAVAIAAAYGKQETSGGWGHPRCVVLAVRTCPHFTDPFPVAPGSDQPKFQTVAWRWNGDGVGVDRPEFEAGDRVCDGAEPLTWDALRAWAKHAPLG